MDIQVQTIGMLQNHHNQILQINFQMVFEWIPRATIYTIPEILQYKTEHHWDEQHHCNLGTPLLTWFNFNLSMDK